MSIASDDVTLDGLTFDAAGPAGAAGAAVRNDVSGLSNVAVLNSDFAGYTGRTIAFGFAEGVSQSLDRGSNFTLAGNTIVQSGTNATAIAAFDTDGVDITNNDVSYAADAGAGQRGINLDGSSQVEVVDNDVVLNTDDQWVVQVAMSKAPVRDVSIINNRLSGGIFGVLVLSQRDVTGLSVVGNDFKSVVASAVNAGAAPPVEPVTTFSNLRYVGNTFTASGATSPYFLSLRDLHTDGSAYDPDPDDNRTIVYRDVQVTGNRTGDVCRHCADLRPLARHLRQFPGTRQPLI